MEAGNKNETIEVEVKEEDYNDPSINEEEIGILLDEVVKENYWDYFKTRTLWTRSCVLRIFIEDTLAS